MKKIFFLLIFELLCAKQYNFSYFNKDFISQWKNILHLETKNFGEINKYFYLSYPYVNYYNELILDLNEIRKRNKKFICNFPYRYLFLKKYFNLSDFDLKQCNQLQKFVQNFSKEKLGIVFSAEYSSSPQSSFGHVMLIFEDKNSLLNSDVVHFAAKPDSKDGFFKYSYKGLTGGYPAFYIREKFFRKHYLYNIIQQRTMFIYWLNYDKNDIKNLIYHIYELRKFQAKYYFLTVNCSSALIDLIKVIDHKINDRKIYPFLPIYSVFYLKHRIVSEQILYPLEVQIVLLEHKLSENEKKIFYNILTLKNINYDIKNRSNTFKELLYKYYLYKFTKYHFVYPNYNKVEQLSFKLNDVNYSNVTLDPLHKPLPSKISFQYLNDNEYLISFRPFLIDLQDKQKNILDRKIYEIFTPEFLIKKDNVKLNKFYIYHLKSFNINYSPYLKPFSWGISLNLNRENKKKLLCFNTEINYGYTYNIKNIIFSFLGGIGIDLNKNYNHIYIKPEIYLLKNFYNSSITIHLYYKTFENYKKINIAYNYYINNITISLGKIMTSLSDKNYITFSINF